MHRLLERQLRKAFGEKGPPEAIRPLLKLVNEAYETSDDDRELLERAMDIAGLELAERNRELADKVERLEAAQAELAEEDAWRRRFINAAAHELNTPLTPLKLQVRTLEQTMDDPRRFAHSLAILTRNVDRLAFLVSDLLDAAKIQSEHLALQPEACDVSSVVQHAVDSMEPLAAEHGVELESDVDGPIDAVIDPLRFGQVLDNLLSNAIKFTPPEGRVRIVARANAAIQVTVQDNGIGLREEEMRMLFRPFTQVHEGNRDGTGLGLYVSQGIMRASGGTLEVHSDGPGKGASFTATLPRVD